LAHIAQDKARIDFEWDGNISKVLPDIQKEALRMIEANQEIISAFSDEVQELAEKLHALIESVNV
jgi:Ser-tRNA(Ala) deacylase AlaX